MIVSLTFDDGYGRHFEIAKVLYGLDVRASFYVITGLQKYCGKNTLIKEPKLLKEMHDMGHEIGSHTHTHRNLTLIDDGSVERECRISANVLEEVLGERPMGLAYPYGAHDERVIRIVSEYYRYARTMGELNRWNEHLDSHRVGSMGIRHLIKYPLRALAGKNTKLVVLTFHDEPLRIIRLTVELLKDMGFRMMPLREALMNLGVI